MATHPTATVTVFLFLTGIFKLKTRFLEETGFLINSIYPLVDRT
ncbi:MAG: hypothetical protein ABI180_08475 [Microcoleus sp.]|jgi:hypothetical protein